MPLLTNFMMPLSPLRMSALMPMLIPSTNNNYWRKDHDLTCKSEIDQLFDCSEEEDEAQEQPDTPLFRRIAALEQNGPTSQIEQYRLLYNEKLVEDHLAFQWLRIIDDFDEENDNPLIDIHQCSDNFLTISKLFQDLYNVKSKIEVDDSIWSNYNSPNIQTNTM